MATLSDPLLDNHAQLNAESLHMVNGEYYDLRTFEHPGGRLVLQQSVGKDITASVASHHLSDAPYIVMKKYMVQKDSVVGTIAPCGYSFNKDGFFETLKRRVAAKIGHRPAQATGTYYTKVAVVGLLYIACWTYCCFFPVWWVPILLASVMRVVLVGIGHEAIHGRGKMLWHLFDIMMCFPSEKWHFEHCLEHHPHTKRFDLDPDETLFALRMNEKTTWKCSHRVQVLTQCLMGPFMSLVMFIEHHLLPMTMVLQSTAFIFLFQLAPLITHPDGFYSGLTVCFGVVGLSNCMILHAFHTSHINEKCSSKAYDHKDGIDWGEHQLRTTCNWQSGLLSVTGMLELQIEHHLLPALPYALQKEIVPIVKDTAKEFSLPYYEYPSLFHGMFAHMGFLHALGNESGDFPDPLQLLAQLMRPLWSGIK